MFGIRRRVATQHTQQVEPEHMIRALLARQAPQEREALEPTAIIGTDQGSSFRLTQTTSRAHEAQRTVSGSK